MTQSAAKARIVVITDELVRARLVRGLQNASVRDDQGRPLRVTVERVKKRRSLPQNSTLHAWIHLLALHTGSANAEMKDDLKRALLPVRYRRDAITGEEIEVLASTSKLDKMAFADFMARLEAFASDFFGVKLPSPNDPQGRWEIERILQEAA